MEILQDGIQFCDIYHCFSHKISSCKYIYYLNLNCPSFLLQPIEASDEAFWEQFWSECVTCVQDVFTLIPAAEIRALREESPSNLATLCYKAVEKLVSASESGCPSQREQQIGAC